MNREDLRAFAARDWSLLAGSKTEFWIQRKREMTAADVLAVGDALRRHALAVHPDWPSPPDREADLAVHQRVSEALCAVTRRTR